MSEIDDLLSELQQEYQEGTPKSPKPSASLGNLLEEVQGELNKPVAPAPEVPQPTSIASPQPSADNEAQREKRRQQALEQKARLWLSKLNPQSEEGRWFEEFAYSYDSRVKAAMDYLEALKDVGIK
jgi:hypothetical protein